MSQISSCTLYCSEKMALCGQHPHAKQASHVAFRSKIGDMQNYTIMHGSIAPGLQTQTTPSSSRALAHRQCKGLRSPQRAQWRQRVAPAQPQLGVGSTSAVHDAEDKWIKRALEAIVPDSTQLPQP
jgi:hypothetical protein